MAGYTALSDDAALVATLSPADYSSSSATLGWVNMEFYKRAMFVVQTGAVAGSESVTASVVQATSSTGAGSKALTNPVSITAITASNKSAVANVNGPDLDTNNGFQYAALSITFVNVATNAATGTNLSGVAFGDPQATPPPAYTGSQVVPATGN